MSKKQTVFNLLFLVIVFGLTMYLVFRGKDIGDIIRIFYSWRIGYHFLYDENTWSQCENDSLCTVFLCWIFFQLYYSVCIRRTAHADLLHEKR